MPENLLKRTLLILLFFGWTYSAFSQQADSTKAVKYFSGSVMLTTKGISTIPNFTLGKPAAVFIFTFGKKIRFEPELRFSLEGKPWMFILWWRTELYKSNKFAVRLGANPTFAFKTMTASLNGVPNSLLVGYRTLTADLTPTWYVTKNFGLGMYYMYVYGIEDITTRTTHYIALRSYFSNIRLSGPYFLKFNPQCYFLYQDGITGTYLSANLSLNSKQSPFSLATMLNRSINTDIPVGKGLVWNVSVSYAFSKTYLKK